MWVMHPVLHMTLFDLEPAAGDWMEAPFKP